MIKDTHTEYPMNYTYDSRPMGLLPDAQSFGLRMRRECREQFSPPPRVSDPDMHHNTSVTHVP